MLLLYLAHASGYCALYTFTFHYASTLSSMTVVTHETIPAFTFHYASTLSSHWHDTTGGDPDLHSTMLLLYQRSPDDYSVGVYKFTFHYASTLSPGGTQSYSKYFYLHSTMLLLYHIINAMTSYTNNNLHSTMLLLYLEGVGTVFPIEHIYIPLCFYFIRYPLSFVRSDVYLHSTMLLLYLVGVVS